jgi:hypothetical protein
VKSVATRRFWNLFSALPRDVQNLAVKNYKLWRENPSHPSLHFRRLKGGEDRFTIRIGDHYRAWSPEFWGSMSDPAFSNALDRLVLADLRTVPSAILDRYMGRAGAASFRARHANRDIKPGP